MSSGPIPISASSAPFEAVTTPNIERANRLMSVRSHPGFLEILRISQNIVQMAVDNCADYPGWDAQQIVVMKVRMQCAKEHHQLILSEIQRAIEEGVGEAREQVANLPAKSAEDAVDQGDFVRQRVLETFSEMDNRLPGTF